MECPKVINNNLNSHVMYGILPLYINIWNLKFTKNYKKEYHNINCVFLYYFVVSSRFLEISKLFNLYQNNEIENTKILFMC